MSTALTGQGAGDNGQGGNASGGAGGTGNQNNTPDWRTSLPEDLRSEKVFESIKGKDWSEAGPVLAKNYLNAQKLVGAEKLVIPGKDATPEQIAEFRTKLGVPAKPEEYGLKLPEGLTEDKLDKARVDAWKKHLHDQGVPKAAAEALITQYLTDEHSLMQARAKAQADEQKAWATQLKEQFGNEYDTKVNLARYALEQFKDPALISWLEETGAGSHPAVVAFFSKVGQALSDDSPRSGGGSGTGGNGEPRTAAQAQAALNEFNRNESKQKALWDHAHPQHDAVVAEKDKLFKLAYPDDEK